MRYYALGRHAEALDLREQTLELAKATLGPEHRHTLSSMHNLAQSYAQLDRHADAVKLLETTVELRKSILGTDHSHTLQSMNNLGNSYSDQGRHDDAVKLLEQTVELKKNKLGADHPDTLTSMANLAYSYTQLGRRKEAVELLEQTVELSKDKLGTDHPDTHRTMNSLANSYAALEQFLEALELRQELCRLQQAEAIKNDAELMRLRNQVISAYRGSAEQDAVEPFLREQLDFWRDLESTHSDPAGCQAQLFHIHLRLAAWLRSTGSNTSGGIHFGEVLQAFDRLAGDPVRRRLTISTYLTAHRCSLPALDELTSEAERELRERMAGNLESTLAEVRQEVTENPASDSSVLNAWNALSMAYYRERNWQGAEEEARLAMTLLSRPGRFWHMVPLFVLAGNHDEYRQVCQRLINEWGHGWSDNDLRASTSMLFLMCLSDPEPPADPNRVLELLRQAAEGGPDRVGRNYEGTRLLLSGTWPTETLQRLSESDGSQDPFEAFDLALASAHVGQFDAARAWLEEGDRRLDEFVDYQWGGTRLNFEIRRHLAKQLIEAGSPP